MNNYPVGVKKNRALPLKVKLFSVYGGVAQTDADLAAPALVQVFFDGDSEPAQDVSSDALSAGQGSEGNQFVFTGEGGLLLKESGVRDMNGKLARVAGMVCALRAAGGGS